MTGPTRTTTVGRRPGATFLIPASAAIAALAGVGVIAAFALAPGTARAQAAPDERMSFFLTSVGPGDGADLGGLEGADAWCRHLAFAVGQGDAVWRAYLSTTGAGGGQGAVNARDRIGTGPWHNFRGEMIAADVEQLHSDANNVTGETVLTESGESVRGRGASPNRHDILTGSGLDGRAVPGGEDTTCSDWTSSGDGSAMVGHFDRTGGGPNPTSWNAAHGSRGCGQQALRGTGGDGLFYCFKVDGPGTP